MQTVSEAEDSAKKEMIANNQQIPRPQQGIEVGLMTACRDRHYAFGLAMALISDGVHLDFVGGDEIDSPELHTTPKLHFLNFRPKLRGNAGLKLWQLVLYYARIIRYGARRNPKILHILWNNKLEFFDRIILMPYYKMMGKKVVLTAHNVNAARRDSRDSWLNRATLGFQYRLCDRVFVHTEKMKSELIQEFGVRAENIAVIPYGINNAVPHTELTGSEAKRRLGVQEREKTILFFGNIGPYKGLDHLIAAFQILSERNREYRLVIAGKERTGAEQYMKDIREATAQEVRRGRIIQRIEHIPDAEIETYFMAADVVVLPYTSIFQSGILFLGQSFGMPVIATDVGSLREDIIENETGFLCKPSDPGDLARAIETYFESDLFRDLINRRQRIREHACKRHSWDKVGEMTNKVYAELLRDKDAA